MKHFMKKCGSFSGEDANNQIIAAIEIDQSKIHTSKSPGTSTIPEKCRNASKQYAPEAQGQTTRCQSIPASSTALLMQVLKYGQPRIHSPKIGGVAVVAAHLLKGGGGLTIN